MSLHRLSAGAGYQYLLRHTACGDVERDPATPLTAYYTDSGYPPGRWVGDGLGGFGAGAGLPSGSVVSEAQMSAVYGAGRDPISGDPLGKAYPVYKSAAERTAARVSRLSPDLEGRERAEAVAAIQASENARVTPCAVAGFDLTFTAPKSASVLWALSDPVTQRAVVDAHRAAVDQALDFVEERALFTRVGVHSCAQVPTQGMVSAAFDHWDTRSGDPNLHTHVVVANKVQGVDGRWRSMDSRALHHAVVTISELYDDLFADELARRLPVTWSWRPRGPRRTPAFEVDGVEDGLLSAFSSRSSVIDAGMRAVVADFWATHGRGPSRVEILRLRQRVTRDTRPAKVAHRLTDLIERWRDRARQLTGRSPRQLSEAALHGGGRVRVRPLRADQVPAATINRLAAQTLEALTARRSTWNPWNVHAEAARTTRGLRMANPEERLTLHDRVVESVLEQCLPLDPPQLFSVPDTYRRSDGTSAFRRPGEEPFTHASVLRAEQRLLDATTDATAPTALEDTARRIATHPQLPRDSSPGVLLAADQVEAVVAIATSGRRLDILVGPAGTGKTTTLIALRRTWESAFGHGSVIGLAPSATAARELGTALSIECENTAKWLYETTGSGGQQRSTTLDALVGARADTATHQLRRQQAHWQLHPGQLLIVDEASLAGTFTLDTLAAQAERAGAKVLLVGDHRQLSAVDAGGAFGLLADTRHAHELHSLWRFRNRWEAGATRQLRHGDPAALDAYAAHDRITTGPGEAIIESAYLGWQTSERAGASSILVAADAHSVAALNARAHDDRVLSGLVAPQGITTADGTTICRGDRVVTRLNQRRIRVPGGHLRNGALWEVETAHADGSLTVTPAASRPAGPAVPQSGVRLPPEYVSQHVELGYATTIHRAQGITVDQAHVVATPGMSREALYVAMTRGRDANHVYVATDALDPMCDELPDLPSAKTASQVLTDILATERAEVSATQTMRRRQDAAASLTTLHPIRATLIADATARHWQPLLPSCGLTPEQTAAVFRSLSAGALFASLRGGESAGHDMAAALAHVIRIRALDNPADAARDVAAVLHERVSTWLDAQSTERVYPYDVEGGWSGQRPHDDPGSLIPDADPATASIREIDELIRRHLSKAAADVDAESPPVWRSEQAMPAARSGSITR